MTSCFTAEHVVQPNCNKADAFGNSPVLVWQCSKTVVSDASVVAGIKFLVHWDSLFLQFWLHLSALLKTGHQNLHLLLSLIVVQSCEQYPPRHSRVQPRLQICSHVPPWHFKLHVPSLQVCLQYFPWHSRSHFSPSQVSVQFSPSWHFILHFPGKLSYSWSQCSRRHFRPHSSSALLPEKKFIQLYAYAVNLSHHITAQK